MRTKRVLRHYCDHCSKGFFKIPSVLAHEKSCMKNPDRQCYTCKRVGGLSDLIAIVDNPDAISAEEIVSDLRGTAESCPACILAAILQSENNKVKDPEDRWFFDFDYKTESDEYRAQKLADTEEIIF